MRKVVINIAVLAAFLAGIWVGDMIGDPDLDARTAILGRIVAAGLGFLAAVGLAARFWGYMTEDMDFKDR